MSVKSLRARHIWIAFATCALFAAPIARAQIVVGSDGANETDVNNYSGAQTLTKIGSNTVTLTGSNIYAGATTAEQGGLTVLIA